MNLLIFVNAVVVLVFALLMGINALIFPATAKVFGESFVFLGFIGLLVAISVLRPFQSFSRSHTFLLTSSLWISGGMAGAAPLLLWGLTPVDAVFESFSGITTTGATVMSGLDQTPPGILMWRAVLQALAASASSSPASPSCRSCAPAGCNCFEPKARTRATRN